LETLTEIFLGAVTPARVAAALAIATLAGVLRGFSGFGLALAAVPGLTLVLAPREVVPCVLLLQLVAGIQLVPSTRHLVDWPSLGPILAGAIVATPIGTMALATVPADPMRAAIGAVLLVAVALLWRAPPRTERPALAARLAIGLVSGVLNGGTAMAGPPVVAYFLATSARVEVGRASLFMYFLLLSVAGAGSAATVGLVTKRTLALALLLLPAIVVGNGLGHRLFGRASPEAYRRVVLVLLVVMAVLAIARSLLG
jgi:uncharacterized protein